MHPGDELELQSFDCPRCQAPVQERFWGPCGRCRAELTASQQGRVSEVETGRFEPAMHVVPNHVATKD
jgi:hypothetical protein